MSWCLTHIDYMSNLAGVKQEARFAPRFCQANSRLFFSFFVVILLCEFCFSFVTGMRLVYTIIWPI